MTAVVARGRRNLRMMVDQVAFDGSCPRRIPTTSRNGMLTEPRTRERKKRTTKAVKRIRRVVLVRIYDCASVGRYDCSLRSLMIDDWFALLAMIEKIINH